MNGYSYTEEQVISEFTLALLEDSGYYKANYYTGGLMRFGKNKGCAFLEEQCVDKSTHEINPFFSNEFFDDISGGKTIEASCSSGRQSRAYKAWYTASNVPEEYQYFDDPDIAGFEPADYCPVPMKYPTEEELSYYVGHCSNIGSLEYGSKLYYLGYSKYSSKETIKYTGELLTPHSFCYLSSLSTDEVTSNVVRAICYETFCSNESLTIKIFDDYIVCPRAGGKIVVEGYLGYLLCPDYNLICTGTVICNNIFDCIEKKSEIKEESFTYDYDIKTSQDIEKTETDEIDGDNNYELSTNGQCPQYCKHCKARKKCLYCIENYGLKLEDDNSIICVDLEELEIGYYINNNNVHIKCIDNCDKCENSKTCSKCHEGFMYINKACIEIPESKKDKITENCLEYNYNFECLNCESGYAFKKNDKNKCYETETYFEEYYTKDNGLSYFPCSSQDTNCKRCYYNSTEFKVRCTYCVDGLILLDIGKGMCKTKEEIANTTKYYLINNTHAGVCSKDIKNCNLCDSIYNCLQCKPTYEFDYSENKCISKFQSQKETATDDVDENKTNKTKVRRNRYSFSNYFRYINIFILQTIYIVFLLIKF